MTHDRTLVLQQPISYSHATERRIYNERYYKITYFPEFTNVAHTTTRDFVFTSWSWYLALTKTVKDSEKPEHLMFMTDWVRNNLSAQPSYDENLRWVTFADKRDIVFIKLFYDDYFKSLETVSNEFDERWNRNPLLGLLT